MVHLEVFVLVFASSSVSSIVFGIKSNSRFTTITVIIQE